MNAVEIFKQLIGERLTPLIVKYEPYKDVFTTHPYRHIFDENFERNFTDVIFDSVMFYAYEKDEIEKEYNRGKLEDLRKAARVAYENRVPKTEKVADGLLGELTLDSFIKLFFPNIEMLYSRAKYMERIPYKEETAERKGHEIKGYDGMVFSIEDGQKYFWVGQAKTGYWEYCLSAIKDDINKSVIKYYFGDSMAILCDIMRAVSSASSELSKIIDDINDRIYDNINDRFSKIDSVIDYFKQEQIKIRIPCLLMPNESNYADDTELLNLVISKIHNTFKDFEIENKDNLDVEILLLVFPLRDLKKVRELFLEVRKV